MLFAHCTALLLAAGAPKAERSEFASKHMGTEFRVTLYAADRAAAEKAAKAAFARVAALDKALSDYDPKSEAMRLCAANDAEAGKPREVSADLFAVLSAAQETAKLADGAFDATVGPMSKLWRLTRRTQQLPNDDELAKVRAVVGYRHVTLDAKARTVTLAKPGMRLDFGGIAKGFAADEALKLLKADFGIASALVAASGDIACGDAPPDAPGWRVEVAPIRKGGPVRHLLLKNAAVSTSGDLDQVALVNGVRYSHVLNPKTGLGLTGRRSVTVVAPTGTRADSLTKVASVLPAPEALKLLEALDGVACYLVVQEADDRPEAVTASPRFKDFLDPTAAKP